MIFSFLLVHEVQVKSLIGHNAYGSSYGESFTAQCRIEPYNQIVRDEKGTDNVPRYRAFFDASVRIFIGSSVFYQSKEYKVISVAEQYGFGFSHVEVLLQ
ncbi:hypothetical protein [Thermoactinomyces sp. DSM 45892]|uniref:hypothetical protein n=1 Tax=Thermoactinomyces sp. DSM 45892 TaxID=1882753 RepID=UPI00089CC8BC|nr:hypothetical protein [Thermoactinomyces sp. DSM 45892]SDZ00910.1 hypothetical protein SAMN05444416_111109 [Thermoactinomyces sp. DSM 45892]